MRVFLLTALLAVSITLGADWSQWRGPNFNGISEETDLLNFLGPENTLWKAPLSGPAEATPAIVGDSIYVSGYNKGAKELFAVCIDAKTGKQRWSKVAGIFDKLPRRSILASPSPVADESGGVFLYSDGTLVKYTPKGNQLWKRNIVTEYGPIKIGWNYSSSPLLYDGRVYIQVLRRNEPDEEFSGSMPAYLLAVDMETGDTIFKTDRATDAKEDFNDAYTTPIPAVVNGKPHIIIYGGNYITGHEPATGKELFRYNYMDQEIRWGRTAATPVLSNGLLFCPFPSAHKLVTHDLAKLAANEPSILWTLNQSICDVPSPVVVDGYVYFITDNKKTLTCLDAKTGTVQWTGQMDKSDTYYASITAADGKLFMVNRKGVVSIVETNPAKFKMISSCDFGEKPVDSNIAISNGKIYLRTALNLYCFGKKEYVTTPEKPKTTNLQ